VDNNVIPIPTDNWKTQHEFEASKCREWGISPKLLPVIRKYFVWGFKASQAAREHGYHPQYIRNVVAGLKKRGLEDIIRTTLKPYEEKEMEDEFWTAIKSLIMQKNVKAMELYAKITGKIKTGDGGGKIQLNQQFNITEADKLLKDI